MSRHRARRFNLRVERLAEDEHRADGPPAHRQESEGDGDETEESSVLSVVHDHLRLAGQQTFRGQAADDVEFVPECASVRAARRHELGVRRFEAEIRDEVSVDKVRNGSAEYARIVEATGGNCDGRVCYEYEYCTRFASLLYWHPECRYGNVDGDLFECGCKDQD